MPAPWRARRRVHGDDGSARAGLRPRALVARRAASASPGSTRPMRTSAPGSTRRRHFPRRREVELPFPDRPDALFMREVADVHRGLFAENADLYGGTWPEDRALPRGHGGEVAAAARHAGVPRAAATTFGGSTCSSRRRCRSSRRRRTRTSCAPRPLTRFTTRSTPSGGLRWRSRAGRPRTGCRRRSSWSAGRATTRSCSRPARRSKPR